MAPPIQPQPSGLRASAPAGLGAIDEQAIAASLGNRGIAAAVLVPNLILLAVFGLYWLGTRWSVDRVRPVVLADTRTAERILGLEQLLDRDPGDGMTAVELAHFYQRVGEVGWSYAALRSAEEHGGSGLSWRMRLGLAYLEIGKNADGLRVLQQAWTACERTSGCGTDGRVRVAVAKRVAELLIARKIDVPTDPDRAAALWNEVLQPVANRFPMHPPATAPTHPAQGSLRSGGGEHNRKGVHR